MYFIRHGTSEWNLLGKWQGQTDTLLAPEGEAQARREGHALADSGVKFDAIRCSDLKRAHRTAVLLAAVCGASTSLEVRPDARLRECSLGIFEGKHKSEIFGPKYAGLFRRLSALPHEARIRTAYFDDLETPLEISERVLAAARDLAASAPPGGTIALVTHSVILESLCASAFHKDFESVHTQTLAWLRCTEEGGQFRLEDSHGAEYVDSPDALALDPGAASLAPATATSTTHLRGKNAIACASGIVMSVGVAAAGNGMPLATKAVAALGSGLATACGAALSLRHCAVRDARVTAAVNGGIGSLAIAGGLLKLPGARPLSLIFAIHAAYAFGAVAASEVLTGLGRRVSLRAGRPWGLWMPRVVVARPAAVAGSKPDVAKP